MLADTFSQIASVVAPPYDPYLAVVVLVAYHGVSLKFLADIGYEYRASVSEGVCGVCPCF